MAMFASAASSNNYGPEMSSATEERNMTGGQSAVRVDDRVRLSHIRYVFGLNRHSAGIRL
jgi:hypothetical protein